MSLVEKLERGPKGQFVFMVGENVFGTALAAIHLFPKSKAILSLNNTTSCRSVYHGNVQSIKGWETF